MVCEHFLSATDHMDYYPSIHVAQSLSPQNPMTHQRSKGRACSSCKMRQHLDLSADGIEYLSKLKCALQSVNRKLHHNIMKTHPRVTSKGVKRSSHPSLTKSPSRQK